MKVLVVDDNEDAAESLRELLVLGGHIVETAANGAEALERAKILLPEVMVCDIGLPGMDGYAVARAIRNDPRLRAMRLVALSGYTLAADVARAKSAGFDEHLAKPPTIEAIERSLTRPC